MADGVVAGGPQVVGEQARQVERHGCVRGRAGRLAGNGERVELVGELAGSGGVQDAADGLGRDVMLAG
ncbi:hypothetical protein [Actinomadura sp. 6N118]|uniref:hypothetical protein n=1 Tax=Actinomadura sp. 6N118 TaxID=3375151 RepID=UPI0037A0F8EE